MPPGSIQRRLGYCMGQLKKQTTILQIFNKVDASLSLYLATILKNIYKDIIEENFVGFCSHDLHIYPRIFHGCGLM